MGAANLGGILMILTCALAWVRGDLPERAGASLLFATWSASRLLLALVGPTYNPSNQWLQTVMQLSGDIMLSCGLLILAIRYSSLWLGGVLLIQGAELTLHSIFLGPDRSSVYNYIVVSNSFSYLFLLVIVSGTLASWRRRVLRRRLPRPGPAAWPAAGPPFPALSLAA